MSLSRPTASITLDGQSLTSAEAGLISVRLDLGFNSHDRVQLDLWQQSKLAGAGPGSELSVGLSTEAAGGGGLLDSVPGLPGGGGDDTLFTGTVQSVSSSADKLSITGISTSALLSNTRRSATWSDQSVADIVEDLAGDLDNEIEADLDLQNYSVDNGRSVWSYLYELAQLAGAELSCSATGGVRFIIATKETAIIDLRYGADLIDWRLSHNQAMTPVGAAEHAAASSAGNEKWHWLAHDPVGSGGDAVVVPAAFRTREAAEAYTTAASARSQRATLRGDVWVVGRSELRPGSMVELKDLPSGSSGPLRVRAVTHQLDGVNGFITALSVEAATAGGGLGGLL